MVIVFDKSVDSNINTVKSGNVEGSIFYWQSETAHGWLIDEQSFKIRMGADDTTIFFNNKDGMQPYIQQFIALSSMYNPATDGVNEDAFYDKPETGDIIAHRYIDTDIEKDLIEGK
jgi:hypothetical protein